MGKFKHTSIKDQMEKFNLTEAEATEKIRLYKEKLSKRKKRAKGKGNPYSIKYQMEKFNLTEAEAKEKIDNLKKKTGSHYDLKYQMEKFNLTEAEAKEKIDNLKKKTATGHLISSIEWQMKKFNLTEAEAKEKIDNAFIKRKESYIKLKETDEFRWRAIRPFNKEHWLNKGYNEDESIKKANEIAENNRQAFIRKMNNPEYAEKHFKKCVGYKNYELPSGKIAKLQGYEPQVLDKLLQTYSEDDIVVGIKEIINTIGIIRYKFKNNEHMYYPDFYIKSTNTIIEVKSQWTFDKWREKNIAKQKACLAQGFNFKFIIYD